MDSINFNEKPSISRKIEKGRRHKGYEKLKKHLSKDAYLTKSIIIDNDIGNREKNRLVSEASNDSISPIVSYSLNRKNRWNTITPLTLNINAITSLPNDMTVAVVEQMNTIPDIGCKNEKTNKHFIEGCVIGITMSNEDGYIIMKKANGRAGAQLSSLLRNNNKNTSKTPDRENNDTDDLYYSPKGKTQVRYHINIAQKNTNYSIGVHYKRQLKAKLKKGELDEDNIEGGNLKESKRKDKTYRKLDKKYNFDVTELMSDYEDISEDDEDYSMSRSVSPKFSLADFVKESSPVVVDKEPIKNIYRSVPSNENKIEIKEMLTIPDKLRIVTLFHEFKINVSKWKEFNFEDVNKLIEEKYHNIKWIDNEKSQFQVDFGNEFRRIYDITKELNLLVIVKNLQKEKNILKVTFNGSFEITNTLRYYLLRKNIKSNIISGIKNGISTKDFLDTCFNTVTQIIQKYDINRCEEECTNESEFYKKYGKFHNCEELSTTVKPLDNDEVCEILDIELSKKYYSNFNAESDDSIEKDNFKKSTEIDSCSESCAICIGTLFLETSISFNECKHTFCGKCIRKALFNQLRLQDIPLHCILCQRNFSTKILPTIFPLPIVSFYIYCQYSKEMDKKGIKISKCLKCNNIVNVDSTTKYNIVDCQKCNVYWCILCNEPPHFPLTCKQNNEWKIKFHGKGEVINKTETTNENKFKLYKFLNNAKKAHEIRFNDQKLTSISMSWRKEKFGKSDKQKFLKYRRTILFLIEYGYGWLYVNKSYKNNEFTKIKTILSKSLIDIQNIDEFIIQCEKNNFEMKLMKIKQNIDILLDEFCKCISFDH